MHAHTHIPINTHTHMNMYTHYIKIQTNKQKNPFCVKHRKRYNQAEERITGVEDKGEDLLQLYNDKEKLATMSTATTMQQHSKPKTPPIRRS